MQGTNGSLYGTTLTGEADDGGTVLSLGVGLGLFVETRPTSGQVGATVTILVNNLQGTTSVRSNQTAATVTVVRQRLSTTTIILLMEKRF